MKSDLERPGMILFRHQTLEIRNGQGFRITCNRGGLWITQESDSRDILLGQGGSFVIDHPGLTLVYAFADTYVGFSRPAPPDFAMGWQSLRRWWNGVRRRAAHEPKPLFAPRLGARG